VNPPRWLQPLADKLDDAEFLRSFHKWATIWWATFGLALSLLLMNSVAWVVFMSLWANVASHWAAWQGTRAETNGDTD
jgi:hypothetical protein